MEKYINDVFSKEEKEHIRNNSKKITSPKAPGEKYYLIRRGCFVKIYNKNFTEIGSLIVAQDGEIKHVLIHFQYRGKGLGNILFEEALNLGGYWLYCDGRRAFKMYQKYGFVAIGQLEDYGEKTGKFSPIRTREDFEEFKKVYDSNAIMMCSKDKLNKFNLKWDSFQQEINNFISSNLKIYYDSIHVGDIITVSNGLQGIVEDYDDKFYYVRDNNANTVKIKKIINDNTNLKDLNIEEINKLLLNPNYYIHFDNLQYNNGQTISKHYNYGEDENIINETYLKYCNIKVNNLIYMLNYYKEEYEESYNYVYAVKANDAIKGQMDYSPLLVYSDKPKNVENVNKYYELCSLAYINNKEAKKELKEKYDIDISFKEEYITNKAKVIQGYKIKRP